jgi:hypothetical protein
MNEGVGDATVDVRNLDNGASTSVPTWDAGGYQVPLDPGNYEATARARGRVLGSQRFSIGRANAKADFRLNDAPPPAVQVPTVTPPPSPPVEVRAPVIATVATIAPKTVETLTAAGDDWSTLNINWSNRWRAL